jgi:large subunit ribosomal protein L5
MVEQTYIPRLKQHYDEVVKDASSSSFGYANTMQVPRLRRWC